MTKGWLPIPTVSLRNQDKCCKIQKVKTSFSTILRLAFSRVCFLSNQFRAYFSVTSVFFLFSSFFFFLYFFFLSFPKRRVKFEKAIWILWTDRDYAFTALKLLSQLYMLCVVFVFFFLQALTLLVNICCYILWISVFSKVRFSFFTIIRRVKHFISEIWTLL